MITQKSIERALILYLGDAPTPSRIGRIYLRLFFWWHGGHARRIWERVRYREAKRRSDKLIRAALYAPNPLTGLIKKDDIGNGKYFPIPVNFFGTSQTGDNDSGDDTPDGAA